MLKLCEKTIVVPGTLLAIDEVAGSGTYIESDKEGNKVFSKYVGILDMKNSRCRVIPLSGVYIPKKGDKIIAQVSEVSFTHWLADVNSFVSGMMPLSEVVRDYVDLATADLSNYYEVGDFVYILVTNVTKNFSVKLSMRDRICKSLKGGKIIKVTPSKVPRIIGKEGSMVEVIKKKTNSKIIVGQNGVVWISGGDEESAIKAVQEIEQKSHTSGLTDHISQMLDKIVKPVKEEKTKEKVEKKVEEKKEKLEEKKEEDEEKPKVTLKVGVKND